MIPPFESLEKWLGEHTIWHDVLVLVLTIALAPSITRMLSTFKKFISIPPQRLNVWILKARISEVDNQLQRFYRLRNDQSYLIVECFVSLLIILLIIFLLTLLVLGLIETRMPLSPAPHKLLPSNWRHFTPLVLRLLAVAPILGLAQSFRNYRTITNSVHSGDLTENMYKAKMERLTAELLLRDRKRYYKADSDA
jgi:hypothetical protein